MLNLEIEFSKQAESASEPHHYWHNSHFPDNFTYFNGLTIQKCFSFQEIRFSSKDCADLDKTDLNLSLCNRCSDTLKEKILMVIPLVGTVFALYSIFSNLLNLYKIQIHVYPEKIVLERYEPDYTGELGNIHLEADYTLKKNIKIMEGCFAEKIARAFLCLIPGLGTILYGGVLLHSMYSNRK